MFYFVLAALMACSGGAPAETPAPVVAPPPVDAPPAAPPAAPVAGKVFFVEPADGAHVKSPVKVVFGVDGMAIAPAGGTDPNTGHHHLIIDGAAIPAGTAVPTDDTHKHFGKGQTDAEIALTPGEHTLTMQFADGTHLSYGEAWSATIKVTVDP